MFANLSRIHSHTGKQLLLGEDRYILVHDTCEYLGQLLLDQRQQFTSENTNVAVDRLVDRIRQNLITTVEQVAQIYSASAILETDFQTVQIHLLRAVLQFTKLKIRQRSELDALCGMTKRSMLCTTCLQLRSYLPIDTVNGPTPCSCNISIRPFMSYVPFAYKLGHQPNISNLKGCSTTLLMWTNFSIPASEKERLSLILTRFWSVGTDGRHRRSCCVRSARGYCLFVKSPFCPHATASVKALQGEAYFQRKYALLRRYLRLCIRQCLCCPPDTDGCSWLTMRTTIRLLAILENCELGWCIIT